MFSSPILLIVLVLAIVIMHSDGKNVSRLHNYYQDINKQCVVERMCGAQWWLLANPTQSKQPVDTEQINQNVTIGQRLRISAFFYGEYFRLDGILESEVVSSAFRIVLVCLLLSMCLISIMMYRSEKFSAEVMELLKDWRLPLSFRKIIRSPSMQRVSSDFCINVEEL